MDKTDNLTPTSFSLQVLRLDSQIELFKEKIKILSLERAKLYQAAKNQNVNLENK